MLKTILNYQELIMKALKIEFPVKKAVVKSAAKKVGKKLPAKKLATTKALTK